MDIDPSKSGPWDGDAVEGLLDHPQEAACARGLLKYAEQWDDISDWPRQLCLRAEPSTGQSSIKMGESGQYGVSKTTLKALLCHC